MLKTYLKELERHKLLSLSSFETINICTVPVWERNYTDASMHASRTVSKAPCPTAGEGYAQSSQPKVCVMNNLVCILIKTESIMKTRQIVMPAMAMEPRDSEWSKFGVTPGGGPRSVALRSILARDQPSCTLY